MLRHEQRTRKLSSRGNIAMVTAFALSLAAGALTGGATASRAAAVEPPRMVEQPTVHGRPVAGNLLRADTGRWRGTRPIEYTFQWLRCSVANIRCKYTEIPKATDGVYALGVADVGQIVDVAVTARNSAGVRTVMAKASTPVVSPSDQAPASVRRPTISGQSLAGSTLVAEGGDWQGANPIRIGYRWRVCERDGGACTNLRATGPRLKLGKRLVGHALRVLVTARNAFGIGYGLSDQTLPVAPTPGAVSPPAVVTRPTISGNAQQGQTLTASPGTWSGTQPIEFSFQWRRCDAGGSSCSNIGGGTGRTYALGSPDVGRRLRVVVAARNGAGTTYSRSDATSVVAPAPTPAQAPRNTREPRISGSARVGETLTADPGSWTGTEPISLSYRWRRCDAGGSSCADTTVTATTYRVGGDDAGRTLRVLVRATNRVGSSTAVSNPTAVVQPVPPPSGTCRSITTVSPPERLVVDRAQYVPDRVTAHGQTLTARFHVTATRGGCVDGALVYAVGVPFNRLSAGHEVATGADGWAGIEFRVLPTFDFRTTDLLVLFVRARKPGESLLAGVSTRRLVSVRTA